MHQSLTVYPQTYHFNPRIYSFLDSLNLLCNVQVLINGCHLQKLHLKCTAEDGTEIESSVETDQCTAPASLSVLTHQQSKIITGDGGRVKYRQVVNFRQIYIETTAVAVMIGPRPSLSGREDQRLKLHCRWQSSNVQRQKNRTE